MNQTQKNKEAIQLLINQQDTICHATADMYEMIQQLAMHLEEQHQQIEELTKQNKVLAEAVSLIAHEELKKRK